MAGITFYGITDEGKKRTKNEDSLWPPAGAAAHPYASHPLGELYIVADGMGGYGAGNIASQITVETVREVYYSQATPGDTPQERLQTAIEAAHEQIKIEAAVSEARARMGTTVVALVILEQQLWVAWVGDSRAYLLRNAQLQQLTEDHSVLWEQIQAGLISWQELHYHPQRSKLNNSLTARREEVRPSFLEAVPLQPDDMLLLCSDGLSSEVNNPDIEAILRAYPADEAALALTDAANSPKTWLRGGEPAPTEGGEDNITVIVIHMPEAQPDPAAAPPLTQTQPLGFMPVPAPVAAPPAPVVAPPITTSPAQDAAGSSLKWVIFAAAGLFVAALILVGVALFLFQGSFAPAATAPTAAAAVDVPTATTGVDVALGEAIPTATPAIALPTPQPTVAEPTNTPQPGETPRATSTLAASPTPIPSATPTATPTPQPTATPTATITATPPMSPDELFPLNDRQLLEPENGKVFAAGTTTVLFRWRQGNRCNLPPDWGFELRIWKEGRNPVGAMDAVNQQSDVRCEAGVYSFSVGDLQAATGVAGATEGTFLWDVLLVNISPYQDTSNKQPALVYSFGLGATAERIPTPTAIPTATLTTTATVTATVSP